MSYKYPPIWHQLWDICACPPPARADAHICEEKYELGIDLGSKYQEPPLMPSLMDPCSHHFTQSSRYQGAKMLRPNSRKHFLEIMSPEFCCKNGKSRAFETIFLIHIFWWEGAFCPKKFAQYLQGPGHWAGNLQFLWIIHLFSTLMSWKSASNRRLHPRPVLDFGWNCKNEEKMRNRPHHCLSTF